MPQEMTTLRSQLRETRLACDHLKADVDEWRGLAERRAQRIIELAQAANAARDEAEALRKDAERYRWLRDNSESIHQFYLSTPIWFTGVKFSKENVDSTIDAAMSKETPSV